MANRKAILGAALAVLLAMTFWQMAIRGGRNSRFSAHLALVGQFSAMELVFSASVTNVGHQPIVLDGVRFDWEDREGHRGSIHGFSGWGHTLKPGESTTTTACVPVRAYRVRVSTIDDRPKLVQRTIGRVAVWLRVDRAPAISAWLLRKGLLNDGSCKQHPGPWMANPAASGNGAISLCPMLEAPCRAVPEQRCWPDAH